MMVYSIVNFKPAIDSAHWIWFLKKTDKGIMLKAFSPDFEKCQDDLTFAGRKIRKEGAHLPEED